MKLRKLQFVKIFVQLTLGGGGQKGMKFFTQFFTHNFDFSISHRELTLYTIQINIFRPLDFIHINNCFKSFSVNNNVPKLFTKHSSFLYNSQQYNPHKRTHPKQHLNPNIHIFH